jgi:hypothetical protein
MTPTNNYGGCLFIIWFACVYHSPWPVVLRLLTLLACLLHQRDISAVAPDLCSRLAVVAEPQHVLACRNSPC